MEFVPFNKPMITGKEIEYIQMSIANKRFSGDGQFTEKCHQWFKKQLGCRNALLTTSCTHALELAALLIGIKEGDEVIMPSYTFVSTANAFALRGAKIVFVDIRPDTMNIDEQKVERAITDKTKAIVVVHYAGVACEMDTIMKAANKHNLIVVEDAAQAVMSTYKGRALGTIGNLGCYSFHETKNYNCGEGGALIINDKCFLERAEIIREKGTNRSRFFRGQVDKYTWVDLGSSYLPSELNAAFLYAQLEQAEAINENRLKSWDLYYQKLRILADQNLIELPYIPDECIHNGHMFYVKVRDLDERSRLIEFLKHNGIFSNFHYVPLHSSEAGLKYGRFDSEDRYTTRDSERLLRLPLFYNLSEDLIEIVVNRIKAFFE